jgi:CRP/FNR family transcriptional regulator, cyclic AMP receptor protein
MVGETPVPGEDGHMTSGPPVEIRQLPVFAALSDLALAAAECMLKPAAFGEGTVLCTQDAVARQAFILLSGTAAVTRDGRQFATVGPGDVVGELALLDGLPRTATVTALEPVQVLVMSPREFAGLLEMPGVDDEIRRIAATRHSKGTGSTP